MQQVELPISKSIANRLLVLQALHTDPLTEVCVSTPQDVVLLRRHLITLQSRENYIKSGSRVETATLDVDNCGTAARFLTAYCALRNVGEVVITGCERMKLRPMKQLVDALLTLGADIIYIEKEGFLPVRIAGKDIKKGSVEILQPQSTQFVSALMLLGIEVKTDVSSPYIELTRRTIEHYDLIRQSDIEADWSSAAFWYEWMALHAPAEPLLLKGLFSNSVQGDKVLAAIFAQLGVGTKFQDEGAVLYYIGNKCTELHVDFSDTPDLYPAVAMTCHLLGVKLAAVGTERLKWKESDRENTVSKMINGSVSSFADHRIAMALLAADREPDDKQCIAKSYPLFADQLIMVQETLLPSLSVVVPRRGINDEGKGKKYALHKLITAAETDYVWLQDDDIVPPPISFMQIRQTIGRMGNPDMIILPLMMDKGGGSVLERLQQAEYAAIQQLTIDFALRGRPIMCSGANMIVRRERWLECYPDLYPELPSGDDMFLLEAFKQKRYKISAKDGEAYSAVVYPISNCKDFMRQRMRWAGKAGVYKDRDIKFVGAVVVLANLLQILCPLVLVFKFPLEYRLIRKRDTSVSLSTIVLLELVYPFYMLFSLIGGLLRQRKAQPQF